MNIRDYLLEDTHFILQTLAGLVEIERDRIVSNGLAKRSQLSSLSDVTEYIVKMAGDKKTNVALNSMANLITLLKDIQLPGDFEKSTIGAPGGLGEKFYIALDLPYEGEQFHDLSSIIKDTGKKEKCHECEEEQNEEEDNEDHVEECDGNCEEEDESQEILAEVINNHLYKIADYLGRRGDHEAAYLVERTIKDIEVEAKDKKLF